MERVISATEARIRFGNLMRRVVENDETVIVERDGVPQIVVLSIDQYEHLKGGQTAWDQWTEKLNRFHERLQAELKGQPLESSVGIIRQMREERDVRLTGLR